MVLYGLIWGHLNILSLFVYANARWKAQEFWQDYKINPEIKVEETGILTTGETDEDVSLYLC